MKTTITILFAALVSMAAFAQQQFKPVPAGDIGPQYNGHPVRKVVPSYPHQQSNGSTHITFKTADTNQHTLEKDSAVAPKNVSPKGKK